ncbi:MAG: hypothetical protein Q8P67_22900 [archaeon]|nr:hypothetical protein [archaeon]
MMPSSPPSTPLATPALKLKIPTSIILSPLSQSQSSAPQSSSRKRLRATKSAPSATSASSAPSSSTSPTTTPSTPSPTTPSLATIELKGALQLLRQGEVRAVRWYDHYTACPRELQSSSRGLDYLSPSLFADQQQVLPAAYPEGFSEDGLLGFLRSLQRAPGLEQLRVVGTSSSPVSLPLPLFIQPSFLLSISVLQLRRVQIPAAELRSLLEQLPQTSRSLHSLDLTGSCRGVSGCGLWIGRFLSSTASCTRLNLGDNLLPPSELSSLASGLSANASVRHLNLWGNPFSQPSALQGLSRALLLRPATLLSLNLYSASINDDSLLAGLASWLLSSRAALRALTLGANLLSDASVPLLAAFLRSCSPLRHLNLHRNRFSPQAIPPFQSASASHPSLRMLNLRANSIPLPDLPLLLHLEDHFLAEARSRPLLPHPPPSKIPRHL